MGCARGCRVRPSVGFAASPGAVRTNSPSRAVPMSPSSPPGLSVSSPACSHRPPASVPMSPQHPTEPFATPSPAPVAPSPPSAELGAALSALEDSGGRGPPCPRLSVWGVFVPRGVSEQIPTRVLDSESILAVCGCFVPAGAAAPGRAEAAPGPEPCSSPRSRCQPPLPPVSPHPGSAGSPLALAAVGAGGTALPKPRCPPRTPLRPHRPIRRIAPPRS